MTASTSLRKGQIVRYNGSLTGFAGHLFRVLNRYECDGQCKREGYARCDVCPAGGVLYDLSGYRPGTAFSDADQAVLRGARPKSVTHVPAREAARA